MKCSRFVSKWIGVGLEAGRAEKWDRIMNVRWCHPMQEKNRMEDKINLLFKKSLRKEGQRKGRRQTCTQERQFKFLRWCKGLLKCVYYSASLLYGKRGSSSSLSVRAFINTLSHSNAGCKTTHHSLFVHTIATGSCPPLRLSVMFLFCNCEVLNT